MKYPRIGFLTFHVGENTIFLFVKTILNGLKKGRQIYLPSVHLQLESRPLTTVLAEPAGVPGSALLGWTRPRSCRRPGATEVFTSVRRNYPSVTGGLEVTPHPRRTPPEVPRDAKFG